MVCGATARPCMNIVINPMEKAPPNTLKPIWPELQKMGVKRIQEQLFHLPEALLNGTATVSRANYDKLVQFLMAWATDKTAPPQLQFAAKCKGTISHLTKLKA